MNSDSSLITQLKSRLRSLQDRFKSILHSSRLESYTPQTQPWALAFSDAPREPEIKFRWIKLPPDLEREQNKILRDFKSWYGDFIGLFSNATRDEDLQLKKLYLEMNSWLTSRYYRDVPNSNVRAIILFEATCNKFISFLDQLTPTGESISIFVIDTSAIIDCPNVSQISTSLNINDVVFIFPSTTISELDDLKTGKRNENFRRRLTAAINHLHEITAMGDALSGVALGNGIVVKMLATEPDFSQLPTWLDRGINDDRIVATAVELQRINPNSTITILANDINMHNKAHLAGLHVMKVPAQDEDAA